MNSFTVQNVRLQYVDEGNGLPLLLVHGFPLDHTMWNAQIEALSKKYRVIAPDLRGFGESEASSGVVSMNRFADDLALLLDHAGVRVPVFVCGLSMGGYIAFAFWRKYAARLAGLILCDTRAANDAPTGAAARIETAERVVREGAGFLAESMPAKILSSHTQRERPQITAGLREVILRTKPLGIAAAARGMAQRDDFTAELKNIASPTLIVVGEDDGISPPAEMRATAAAIPGAECVVISQAGHMSPMERPAEVNEAIERFLAARG